MDEDFRRGFTIGVILGILLTLAAYWFVHIEYGIS